MRNILFLVLGLLSGLSYGIPTLRIPNIPHNQTGTSSIIERGRTLAKKQENLIEELNGCQGATSSKAFIPCKYLAYLLFDDLNKNLGKKKLLEKINGGNTSPKLNDKAKTLLKDLYEARFEKSTDTLLKDAAEKRDSFDFVVVNQLLDQDARLKFLSEKFKLSPDLMIHFLKAIEENPGRAGNILAELMFSISPEERAKIIILAKDNIKDLTNLSANKEPFKEYPDFVKAMAFLSAWGQPEVGKFGLLTQNGLLANTTNEFDAFKEEFLKQKVDKEKANLDYRKLITDIRDLDKKIDDLSKELYDPDREVKIADTLKQREELNKKLNADYGKTQMSFFLANFLANTANVPAGEKEKRASDMLAFATRNSDRKYQLLMASQSFDYTPGEQNGNGRQRLILSDKPSEIVETLKLFNQPQNLNEFAKKGIYGSPVPDWKKDRLNYFELTSEPIGYYAVPQPNGKFTLEKTKPGSFIPLPDVLNKYDALLRGIQSDVTGNQVPSFKKELALGINSQPDQPKISTNPTDLQIQTDTTGSPYFANHVIVKDTKNNLTFIIQGVVGRVYSFKNDEIKNLNTRNPEKIEIETTNGRYEIKPDGTSNLFVNPNPANK